MRVHYGGTGPLMLTVFQIKFIHSVLLLLLSGCVVYAVYSAIFNDITLWTWLALLLVLIEGIILAASGWRCPLTTYAEKKGAIDGSVSDLFFPKWLSDRLFLICGPLAAVAAALVVWRWLSN